MVSFPTSYSGTAIDSVSGHERARELFVDEAGRAAMAACVERATGVATVRLTYVEARAAFARKHRERRVDTMGLRRIVARLNEDSIAYNVVEVSEHLARRAGALSERHRLRAYDAVHLAAAVELERGGGEVVFGSFDERLRRAARRARLRAPALTM